MEKARTVLRVPEVFLIEIAIVVGRASATAHTCRLTWQRVNSRAAAQRFITLWPAATSYLITVALCFHRNCKQGD